MIVCLTSLPLPLSYEERRRDPTSPRSAVCYPWLSLTKTPCARRDHSIAGRKLHKL